jgi:biopolymer transport protein ExbB/TolQ
VLAVFGRAEARDFVDLMAVEERYGLDRLFQLASEKDRGFSAAIFADTLDRFTRLRRDEFDLGDRDFERLTRQIQRWRERAIDLEHRRERDRGLDRGLGD